MIICIVTGTDSNFQILLYDAKHFNPYLALDNQMNMRATGNDPFEH